MKKGINVSSRYGLDVPRFPALIQVPSSVLPGRRRPMRAGSIHDFPTFLMPCGINSAVLIRAHCFSCLYGFRCHSIFANWAASNYTNCPAPINCAATVHLCRLKFPLPSYCVAHCSHTERRHVPYHLLPKARSTRTRVKFSKPIQIHDKFTALFPFTGNV